MNATVQALEDFTLNVTQEIRVRASLAATFDALLEEIGPNNQSPDGKPIPMKVEPWPGGRWFRDLGNHDGHLWAHVQAIKRPTLLEFTGPLFMSYPVVSNVQYRLREENGETVIQFHHTAFGLVTDDIRRGVGTGWSSMHERVRRRAEVS